MIEINDIVNTVICADCVDIMKQLPDNCVDLCLCDPPYGIGIAEWDSETPPQKYFAEIFRVSKNQIIFGGNYFALPHTEAWICWDKTYRFARKMKMSEFELAWTSLDNKSKFIRYTCCGNFYGHNENVRAYYDKDPNIHPTQKPVELFDIILTEYTPQASLIFDPFCGSGTTCVAAKRLGRNYIGIDISSEYCDIARKRLKAEEKGLTVKELEKGQGGLFQ